jgi:hypothetical protein
LVAAGAVRSKIHLSIGKVVPTNDFNNVLRPMPVQDQHLAKAAKREQSGGPDTDYETAASDGVESTHP